jgi:hypothetical protein
MVELDFGYYYVNPTIGSCVSAVYDEAGTSGCISLGHWQTTVDNSLYYNVAVTRSPTVQGLLPGLSPTASAEAKLQLAQTAMQTLGLKPPLRGVHLGTPLECIPLQQHPFLPWESLEHCAQSPSVPDDPDPAMQTLGIGHTTRVHTTAASISALRV